MFHCLCTQTAVMFVAVLAKQSKADTALSVGCQRPGNLDTNVNWYSLKVRNVITLTVRVRPDLQLHILWVLSIYCLNARIGLMLYHMLQGGYWFQTVPRRCQHQNSS